MSYHQFPLPKNCLQKVLSRIVLFKLVLSRLVQLSRQSFTIYPYTEGRCSLWILISINLPTLLGRLIIP